MSKDKRESDDMLAEEELIYHLRKITRELDFILDFPFAKFWVYMTKFTGPHGCDAAPSAPFFISYLDEFLQNVRKYNDLDKI